MEWVYRIAVALFSGFFSAGFAIVFFQWLLKRREHRDKTTREDRQDAVKLLYDSISRLEVELGLTKQELKDYKVEGRNKELEWARNDTKREQTLRKVRDEYQTCIYKQDQLLHELEVTRTSNKSQAEELASLRESNKILADQWSTLREDYESLKLRASQLENRQESFVEKECNNG